MAVVEKLTSVPTQGEVTALGEQHALLSSMIQAKQEQLKNLQHLCNLEGIQLNNLKREHEEALVQHKANLETQKDEHYTKLEEERLAVVQLEKALNQRQNNLDLMERDLKEWEARVEPTKEAYAQLASKALEVEQVRIRSSDTEQRASQLEQVGTQRMAEVVAREQAVKELETRHTVLAQELEQQAGDLDLHTKQVAQDTANLEKARADFDPKLKALMEREAAAKEHETRAEALHAEANQKQAENQETLANLSALSSRLEAREQVLTELHAQLTALHAEVSAKVKVLEVAGQPTPRVPELPKE